MDQLNDLDTSLKDLYDVTRNRRDATIIFGGDFNLGDITWENESVLPGASESSCQKLIDILHIFGLSQLQRENTRGDRLLDLYVTDRPALVKSENTAPSISDNDGAIVVDSNILAILNKKTPRKVFIFSKAQWNSVKTDVLNFSTSFLESYKTRSINQNWNDIKSCIESTMNANIPTRTISSKNHKPWLTSDIRHLSRRKHRLYKRAKQSGKPEHNQKFQEVKNLCSKKVKKACVKYINRRVLGGLENGNSKPFWSYIKSLQQEGIGIPSLRVGSTLYSTASDKARILISDFQSVFTREDTSFIAWLGPSKTRIGKVTAQEAGVRKLLSQLKSHKASGPDNIPNRVLRELSAELAPCLTALSNQSLESGTIPDDWSKASISPVFKKGSVHDAANYRPVSWTCRL